MKPQKQRSEKKGNLDAAINDTKGENETIKHKSKETETPCSSDVQMNALSKGVMFVQELYDDNESQIESIRKELP